MLIVSPVQDIMDIVCVCLYVHIISASRNRYYVRAHPVSVCSDHYVISGCANITIDDNMAIHIHHR